MKKYGNKGFSATVVVLSILVLGVIGGVGYYVYNSHKTTKDDSSNTSKTSQTSKSQTKQPDKLAVKDETADWTAFSSVAGKFSLRYPNTWVQPENKDLCSPGLFDRALYIGPDKDSVLKCGSEFFGQVSVSSVDGDTRSDYYLSSGYKDVTKKDVTVVGVNGQRISGIAIASSGDNPFASPEGTIAVNYVFFTNGITYITTYQQKPKSSSPSSDVLKDFDLIVTKTLKFSS